MHTSILTSPQSKTELTLSICVAIDPGQEIEGEFLSNWVVGTKNHSVKQYPEKKNPGHLGNLTPTN
jgi:hypothetical protein